MVDGTQPDDPRRPKSSPRYQLAAQQTTTATPSSLSLCFFLGMHDARRRNMSYKGTDHIRTLASPPAAPFTFTSNTAERRIEPGRPLRLDCCDHASKVTSLVASSRSFRTIPPSTTALIAELCLAHPDFIASLVARASRGGARAVLLALGCAASACAKASAAARRVTELKRASRVLSTPHRREPAGRMRFRSRAPGPHSSRRGGPKRPQRPEVIGDQRCDAAANSKPPGFRGSGQRRRRGSTRARRRDPPGSRRVWRESRPANTTGRRVPACVPARTSIPARRCPRAFSSCRVPTRQVA